MTGLTLSDCCAHTGGTLLGEDGVLSSVSIDTRAAVKGSVFFAISGENFDGHRFVENAVALGAVAVVVEHDCGVDVPQLIVRNTRTAMGAIAQLWRRQFDVAVAVITGSNGKTTVKEMLASILAREGLVHATKGNLNNDIGVPLTLFGLNASHQFAVIELGANAPGEIAGLAAIAEPQVAVVNNVGPAHLQGFGSLQGVANAKGEVFEHLPDSGVAVINCDESAAAEWASRAGSAKLLRYALKSSDAVDVQGVVLEAHLLQVVYQGEAHRVPVPLLGRHNMGNALAAVSTALAMGISWPAIESGMAAVKPVAGRLLHSEVAGVHIIDDSYNANPGSVEAALELLATHGATRWFVLGSMAELGEQAEELHAKAGRQAAALGIERFAGVGEFAVAARRGFGPKGLAFESHEDLTAELRAQLKEGDSVLIKGSRSAGMENVVSQLLGSLQGCGA